MPFVTCWKCQKKIDGKARTCPYCSELITPLPSKYDQNLCLAEQAIDYCYNTLRIKVENQHEGINKGHGCSDFGFQCYKQRKKFKRIERQTHNDQLAYVTSVNELIIDDAQGNGSELGAVGNCKELAIAAFSYLRTNKNVRNIAIYALSHPFDHEFVIFNAQNFSDEETYIVGIEYPPEWIGGIFCDPWHRRCFKIDKNLSTQLPGIILPTYYRPGYSPCSLHGYKIKLKICARC